MTKLTLGQIHSALESGDTSALDRFKDKLAHEDSSLGKFLAHYGMKGMRWGFRKDHKSSDGNAAPMSPEKVKAHNELSDILAKGVKTATREDHLERMIDKAYLNGYIEDNMKVVSVAPSDDGKRVSYEMKVYRYTPGMPNTHAGDGVKVEHISKDVARDPRPGMSILDGIGHEETVDKFLAHYGVKGMRWGIRRREGADGTVTGGSKSETSDAETSKKLSVDAERLVKTTQKSGSEMSDREIREAINRANMVRDYDKLFGGGPNAELASKVEALRLQKEYSQLNAELNPSKLSRVIGFAKAAAPGFEAFKQLDNLTGNVMSSEIKNSFKAVSNPPPKTPKVPKPPKEPKTKKQNASPGPTATTTTGSSASDAARPTTVYNVTDLGRQTSTYPDPTVPQLGR